MILLILFGFVAGAGTALSPCVLPVLPIALSAGATGGRRRPLGIVVGLAVSFTFATVALVYVIDALGLPDDLLRKLAIVVLLGFGVDAADPAAGGPAGGVAEPLRRPRPGVASARAATASGRDCGRRQPRPRLRALRRADPGRRDHRLRLAAVHRRPARGRARYGIGSALVLYLLMLGGRRLTAPLARRGGALQMAMGAVMVVVALAMLGDYDIRFQSAIAKRPAELPRQPDRRPRGHGLGAARRSPTSAASRPHGVGGRGRRRSRHRRARARRRRRLRPAGTRHGAGIRRQRSSWFNTPAAGR